MIILCVIDTDTNLYNWDCNQTLDHLQDRVYSDNLINILQLLVQHRFR